MINPASRSEVFCKMDGISNLLVEDKKSGLESVGKGWRWRRRYGSEFSVWNSWVNKISFQLKKKKNLSSLPSEDRYLITESIKATGIHNHILLSVIAGCDYFWIQHPTMPFSYLYFYWMKLKTHCNLLERLIV